VCRVRTFDQAILIGMCVYVRERECEGANERERVCV